MIMQDRNKEEAGTRSDQAQHATSARLRHDMAEVNAVAVLYCTQKWKTFSFRSLITPGKKILF
jgi:hypothetical protein